MISRVEGDQRQLSRMHGFLFDAISGSVDYGSVGFRDADEFVPRVVESGRRDDGEFRRSLQIARPRGGTSGLAGTAWRCRSSDCVIKDEMKYVF